MHSFKSMCIDLKLCVPKKKVASGTQKCRQTRTLCTSRVISGLVKESSSHPADVSSSSLIHLTARFPLSCMRAWLCTADRVAVHRKSALRAKFALANVHASDVACSGPRDRTGSLRVCSDTHKIRGSIA